MTIRDACYVEPINVLGATSTSNAIRLDTGGDKEAEDLAKGLGVAAKLRCTYAKCPLAQIAQRLLVNANGIGQAGGRVRWRESFEEANVLNNAWRRFAEPGRLGCGRLQMRCTARKERRKQDEEGHA